ncbi:MAG: hypothetical protein CMJ25_26295 [Phycisphaerae bacterium]|nr:hypothetical protein [Phycisphaerae bacterium]
MNQTMIQIKVYLNLMVNQLEVLIELFMMDTFIYLHTVFLIFIVRQYTIQIYVRLLTIEKVTFGLM